MDDIYRIKGETLRNIGNQLRLELDTTQEYPPEDMPLAIHLAASQGGGRMVLAEAFSTSTPNKYLDNGAEKSYNGWSISPYYIIPSNAKAVLVEIPNGAATLSHMYAALYGADFSISLPLPTSNTNQAHVFVNAPFTRFSLVDCSNATYIRVSAVSSTIDNLKVYSILED